MIDLESLSPSFTLYHYCNQLSDHEIKKFVTIHPLSMRCVPMSVIVSLLSLSSPGKCTSCQDSTNHSAGQCWGGYGRELSPLKACTGDPFRTIEESGCNKPYKALYGASAKWPLTRICIICSGVLLSLVIIDEADSRSFQVLWERAHLGCPLELLVARATRAATCTGALSSPPSVRASTFFPSHLECRPYPRP